MSFLKYAFALLVLLSASVSRADKNFQNLTLECRSKIGSQVTTLEMIGVNVPGRESGSVTVTENAKSTTYHGCTPVEIPFGFFVQCTLPPVDADHSLQVKQYIIQNLKLTALTTDLIEPQVVAKSLVEDSGVQCKAVK